MRLIRSKMVCIFQKVTKCSCVPAAHAITGCDTTSSFFGIGKKYMLKALKETPDQFSDLSMISHADVDDSVDLCRKLISRLYDPKGKSKRCHSDLNRFRVKLATCKDSSLIRLPPCEATFKRMHTKLRQLLGHLSSTVRKRESLVWNLSYLKVKYHLISFKI
jgi:hypothetical protein